MIPAKPTLVITKNSNRDYMLNWTYPEYEYFKPGLEHELKICNEFEPTCDKWVNEQIKIKIKWKIIGAFKKIARLVESVVPNLARKVVVLCL